MAEITKDSRTDEYIKGRTLVSREITGESLLTALVKFEDGLGNLLTCRTLLSSGLQSLFITRELQNKLRLSIRKINILILGIGHKVAVIVYFVPMKINSRVEDFTVKSCFLGIDKISGKIHREVLKEIFFSVSGEIDILLGSNIFLKFMVIHFMEQFENFWLTDEC